MLATSVRRDSLEQITSKHTDKFTHEIFNKLVAVKR